MVLPRRARNTDPEIEQKRHKETPKEVAESRHQGLRSVPHHPHTRQQTSRHLP